MAEEQLQWEGKHSLFVLGELGRQYFSKKTLPDVSVDMDFHFTVQKPSMHRARMIGLRMVEEYLEGKLDEIHVIQLLPLKKASFHTELKMGIPADVHHEEIMLVPSADEVLNTIIPNYVVGTIYGCLVESYCSEQNARMTAMDASNRNASEMLKALSIQYNRARQAAITQEITEVIAGAKAQKNKHK